MHATAHSAATNLTSPSSVAMLEAMRARDQLGPSTAFVNVANFFGLLDSPMLDNGCSTDGNQGFFFSSHFHARVVGLQVSAREAFAARTTGFPVETIGRAAQRQYFVLTDGRELPFDSNTFGSVFSQNVLEHAPDPTLYLGESMRVLRPNGVLYASWAPVWSAPHGHHVQHAFGKWYDPTFKADHSIIPPWGHLWLNMTEMELILARRGMNQRFRREIANWIYVRRELSRRSGFEVHTAFSSAASAHGGQLVWSSCDPSMTPGPQHVALAHSLLQRASIAAAEVGIVDVQGRLQRSGHTFDHLARYVYGHCVYVMRKASGPPTSLEAAVTCMLGAQRPFSNRVSNRASLLPKPLNRRPPATQCDTPKVQALLKDPGILGRSVDLRQMQ